MRVVITGFSGMIGSELREQAGALGWSVLEPGPEDGVPEWADPATGGREPDLADPAYERWLRAAAPDAVIHAGACTSSTRCQAIGACAVLRSNVSGQVAVARAARDLGARLVLFGTDSLFDPASWSGGIRLRAGRTPYGPRTLYGASKLAGQLAALQEYGGGALVVYPSFGWGGPRDTMSVASQIVRCAAGAPGYERPELPVSPDPVRGLTWHRDVARLTLALLAKGEHGELPAACLPGDNMTLGAFASLAAQLSAVPPLRSRLTWRPELEYKGDLFYHPAEVERAWDLAGLLSSSPLAAVQRELRAAREGGPLRAHVRGDLSALLDAAGASS